MKSDIKITPFWLHQANVKKIFDVLNSDGGEVRIVGGAVRNHLIGSNSSDVDFATTLLPDTVVLLLRQAGVKVIPTGIDHGTVTAVVDGQSFEITTLRKDIETDGRHAVVAFGTDFKADALRRDFTINALYLDYEGMVYDYVDSLADINPLRIRFIGDASLRIKEDYLRILRFFRFFAWYGKHRPDAEGLKACAKLKKGMQALSAERIWSEMRKLLAAPDPSRALLWMRQTGVLTQLLPESEKWGIDAFVPLIEAEHKNNWSPDPMVRLMSLIPMRLETVNDIATRWRLSNVERDRLRAWAILPHRLPIKAQELRALAYRHTKTAVLDGLCVQAAMQRRDDIAEAIEILQSWNIPDLPINGTDLIKRGLEKGPVLGSKLKKIETVWVESDFKLGRHELLEMI